MKHSIVFCHAVSANQCMTEYDRMFHECSNADGYNRSVHRYQLMFYSVITDSMMPDRQPQWQRRTAAAMFASLKVSPHYITKRRPGDSCHRRRLSSASSRCELSPLHGGRRSIKPGVAPAEAAPQSATSPETPARSLGLAGPGPRPITGPPALTNTSVERRRCCRRDACVMP